MITAIVHSVPYVYLSRFLQFLLFDFRIINSLEINENGLSSRFCRCSLIHYTLKVLFLNGFPKFLCFEIVLRSCLFSILIFKLAGAL